MVPRISAPEVFKIVRIRPKKIDANWRILSDLLAPSLKFSNWPADLTLRSVVSQNRAITDLVVSVYSLGCSDSRIEKVVTMGRPFFPHEADDPDLDWLVSNFLYERPDFVPVETGMLPLVLLPYRHEAAPAEDESVPAEKEEKPTLPFLPAKTGE